MSFHKMDINAIFNSHAIGKFRYATDMHCIIFNKTAIGKRVASALVR